MFTGLFTAVLGPAAAKSIGWVIATLTMIPLLAKVLIVTVQTGEEGYFLRNGKPVVCKKTGLVKLADPGTHAVFPILRQIRVVSTKEVPFDPSLQTLLTEDGIVMDFNMTGQYRRLIDPESMTQSILRVEDPHRLTFNLVMDVLAMLIRTMTYEEVMREPLKDLVHKRCNPDARMMSGVEVTWIGFQSYAKNPAQMALEGQREIAQAIRGARDIAPLEPGVFGATSA